MFSVLPEEFENATISGHFGFVFEENHMIIVTRDVIVFEKLRFQNVFRQHENEKPGFSSSKSVFEMLRFRDGLVVRKAKL